MFPSSLAVNSQSDDSLIGSHLESYLRGIGCIGDTSPEQSEDSSDVDEDIHSEYLEDNFARVEDEDWEIAERGKKRVSYTIILPFSEFSL
jgi:hypothetical protein